MASRVAVVHVELLDVTEAGLWCPACLLPSGVVAVLAVHTGPRTTLQRLVRCGDCGRGL